LGDSIEIILLERVILFSKERHISNNEPHKRANDEVKTTAVVAVVAVVGEKKKSILGALSYRRGVVACSCSCCWLLVLFVVEWRRHRDE